MGCGCKQCREQGCLCDSYAQFFGALSNATRMHVVNALRQGEKNVTQVCDATEIEQSMVSHCLKQLREARIVSSEQRGRQKFYMINEALLPVMKIVDRHVEDL